MGHSAESKENERQGWVEEERARIRREKSVKVNKVRFCLTTKDERKGKVNKTLEENRMSLPETHS